MSDEQQATRLAVDVPETGDSWWRFPTLERQQQLDARLDEWGAQAEHGQLLGPFDQRGWKERLTGADVYYLAVRTLVGLGADLADGLRRMHGSVVHLSMRDLHLEGADLFQARLIGALLPGAHLEHAYLREAHLERAVLRGTHLEYANIYLAHLECAYLFQANLHRANLTAAHLEGANLEVAHLERADLRLAFFDVGTNLREAIFADPDKGAARLVDVRWQQANLAVMPWSFRIQIGDEQRARILKKAKPKLRGASREERAKAARARQTTLFNAWRDATRSNRQLATTMREQGMNTEADYFAFRAQLCQRQLYRVQGQHLRQFGSWLLDLISGYGYQPLRSVATYLLIVALFGFAYWALGMLAGHTLTWNEAGVVSLTAFHGRGFFSTAFTPGDPQAALAAIEAVIGLLIEITFIATFTQRFFAR